MHYASPYRKKKSGKKFWILIAVVVIIGYFIFGKVSYSYNLGRSVDASSTEKISFSIKRGENARNISENLKNKKLIVSSETLQTYLKNEDLDNKIITGRFLLQKSMTIPQVAEIITNPKKAELILTVTEGEKIANIDQTLVEMQLIQKGGFTASVKQFSGYEKYPFLNKETLSKLDLPLEGYLFPDTYFLDPNFSSEELIGKMLDNFSLKYTESIKPKLKPEQQLHKVITVASMLEREVRTDKDLPVVAGIIWKRDAEGWFLNIDATLLYKKNTTTLSKEDLEKEDPYNTYKVKGLTPGPIGNPGIKAILAALQPQTSEYYFYLTKPETGEVVYAKTNDEQNANREKYLK